LGLLSVIKQKGVKMKFIKFIKKSIRYQILGGVVAILTLVVLFTSLFYPAKLKSITLEKVQAQ
jgi:hypothetical protein